MGLAEAAVGVLLVGTFAALARDERRRHRARQTSLLESAELAERAGRWELAAWFRQEAKKGWLLR